jgi:hypothetical protein
VGILNGSEAFNRERARIDPASLPPITVGEDVIDFDHTLAGPEINNVAQALAQNLEIENLALLRRDPNLLTQVDHGDRLTEMQAKLANAQTSGVYAVLHYDFDNLDVRLLVPFGAQTGLSLGFHGTGNVTVDTYDSTGNKLGSSSPEPFDQIFAVRRATGDRWLLVGVQPPS